MAKIEAIGLGGLFEAIPVSLTFWSGGISPRVSSNFCLEDRGLVANDLRSQEGGLNNELYNI